MLERIGTLVKGANVDNIPLGNRSRRKNILQSFRIFYSLAPGPLGVVHHCSTVWGMRPETLQNLDGPSQGVC